jgi:hypothetical protein
MKIVRKNVALFSRSFDFAGKCRKGKHRKKFPKGECRNEKCFERRSKVIVGETFVGERSKGRTAKEIRNSFKT